MRVWNRWTSLTLIAPVVAVMGCGAADDDADPGDAANTTPPSAEMWMVSLTGEAARPTPVETPATGSAHFGVTADGSIEYTLSVLNLSSLPTGAHIHGPAGPGETAPPIVRFTLADSVTSGQIAAGVITGTTVPEITLDSLKTLMRAGMVYVQVHTQTHRGGEIVGVIW